MTSSERKRSVSPTKDASTNDNSPSKKVKVDDQDKKAKDIKRIQPFAALVVDIEGTTTPISFVHDVLFPHVKDNVASFLKEKWTEKELQEKVSSLRAQSLKDVENKVEGAKPILPADHKNIKELQDSVVQNIKWQMSIDRKIGPLKSFQGYMWRFAYESGNVKGTVFEDVVPTLEKLKSQGVPIFVYSSGSIEAQKLIFGYSTDGDLLHFFKDHFDTGIGSKLEKESYSKIAESIKFEPSKILFLSDNVKEIKAARAAGFQGAIVWRKGNAPLVPEPTAIEGTKHRSYNQDGANVTIIESFLEILPSAPSASPSK
ncbi:Enolase-phosphatase E1 [Chytridiales sp. JEL 0842]|nr:Enolase-phosphatase E1 [Chytridiales sp. JEL 0842]